VDIYTEPDEVDPDTLKNLGPLAPLAGIWEGRGSDTHPVAEGTETEAYVERAEFHPIDPQANGPQLFYGLRYHLFIRKVDEVETFHDQVGYWLWEPATKSIIQTLAIPRAQIAMATGTAEPGARELTVRAVRGSTMNGICSGPFLEDHFTTAEYTLTLTFRPDGAIAYHQTTLLQVSGRPEPFRHTDEAVWTKIGAPRPNPLMAG
jgi:hypothetical protein